jgi:hypothetical protein
LHTLEGIYHTRPAYPKAVFVTDGSNSANLSVADSKRTAGG